MFNSIVHLILSKFLWILTILNSCWFNFVFILLELFSVCHSKVFSNKKEAFIEYSNRQAPVDLCFNSSFSKTFWFFTIFIPTKLGNFHAFLSILSYNCLFLFLRILFLSYALSNFFSATLYTSQLLFSIFQCVRFQIFAVSFQYFYFLGPLTPDFILCRLSRVTI